MRVTHGLRRHQHAWAIALALSVVAPALAQKTPSRPALLADRIPVPDGYSVEQDVEANDRRNFGPVQNVNGHILRRFVQAGDDGPSSPAAIAAFYANFVIDQQGVVIADTANDTVGAFDGRLPGAKPVWLHVDINSAGGILDVIALEETATPLTPVPVPERQLAGAWIVEPLPASLPVSLREAATRARDAVAAALSASVQPPRGWQWHIAVDTGADGALAVRVDGARVWQTCATCATTADAERTVLMRVTFSRPEAVADRDAATAPEAGLFVAPQMAGTGTVTPFVTPFHDGTRVLVTSSTAPLFAPVTRERYLSAQAAAARRSDAALAATVDAQVAALAPAERTAPAADRYGRAIVQANPAAGPFAVIELPWMQGASTASLYQRELVEAVLASPSLAALVR
jgi:hypothetical protein